MSNTCSKFERDLRLYGLGSMGRMGCMGCKERTRPTGDKGRMGGNRGMGAEWAISGLSGTHALKCNNDMRAGLMPQHSGAGHACLKM